jgi:hypothetical protein
MTRRRADNVAKIDMRSRGQRYTDPEGRMLPSQMCPEISWGFEQALTFRLDENSWRDSILSVMLDRDSEHGFHLIHAAQYGELLGWRESATVH